MNFITNHLIGKIKAKIRISQEKLKCDNFIYLDEVITSNTNKIDRVNAQYPFKKDVILGYNWYNLDAQALLKIYSLLKENKFYVNKQIEGKFYKIRLKNEKDKSVKP